jgi:type II secretory pathway component GspD/PulD (secretin)
MMKRAIPFLAVLCLTATIAAAAPVTVNDVAIDKLLEGVRVTIACAGSPNVSSFTSAQPPAVIIDVMDATVKTSRERFESGFYPVTSVSIEPSEATSGVRITVRLRDMVEHQVTTENGTIVADFGTTPIAPMLPDQHKDAFAGKRLTLYVKEAEIADILRMIASQFDLNILTTQDVKSQVTVRLNDVPLRVGFDALLKASLASMIEGKDGVIVVKPVKKEMYGETDVRVFDLDYVNADDAQKVVNRTLSPSGNAEVSYRRFSKEVSGARGGSLVVTDIPEALDRIAQVLADYDRPQPQVAIEAKFVETTLNAEDRYGIEWTLQAGVTSGIGGGLNPDKNVELPLIFQNMVLGKVDLSQLQARLEILQSRGLSRVLASPRTVTLDNQPADLSISTQVPERQVTTDPKTGLVLYSWSSRSIPVSIQVTPHVTSDGRVIMTLAPEVSAITGYTGPADDQHPIVSRRSANTQISVRDGEAAIIGGLIQDNETRTVGQDTAAGRHPDNRQPLQEDVNQAHQD